MTEVPEEFILLGRSESCEIEILLSNDSRIFTVQFHSEYFPKYTKLYQERVSFYWKDPTILKDFYLPANSEIEEMCMQHSKKMFQCFNLFMKNHSE